MKEYSVVRQLEEQEQDTLLEFVSAEKGHSFIATKAYAVESHKYKLRNARKLTDIAIAILEVVAKRGLLGKIKDRVTINQRSVMLENLSVRQMLAIFATVQRAVGIFLEELLIEDTELMVKLLEQELCLAINNVQAVMSFLVRVAVKCSGVPNYTTLANVCKETLLYDIGLQRGVADDTLSAGGAYRNEQGNTDSANRI